MGYSSVKPKPNKPYPDFPLYAHNTRRWAKKIKGRTHFFGHWDNWEAALDQYLYERDYLQQGKTPPPRDSTALTVGDMVNSFLEVAENRVQTGEMTKRTWSDYKTTGTILVASLGRHTTVESLMPTDFAKLREELSKTRGLVALGNEIGRCRVFFNFASKSELIERPARFGKSFDKPSKVSLKREKLTKVSKVFSVDELRTIYAAANADMKCFMLLALNGGLGPRDIGLMLGKHIQGDWIRYPRPKTLVDREFKLWPETKRAIAETRHSEDSDSLVFRTIFGASWAKDTCDSPITKEFAKLLKKIDSKATELAEKKGAKPPAKLHQAGRGFYSLRHTFRTVADESLDVVAVNRVMGHSDASIGAVYREWIDPARIEKVCEHVRSWVKPIFAKKRGAK